ncbi:MAG: arsenate reductase ArsC [Porticoccaceae bacterium]|nr:arsenate reductase ArsC [Porticoccaceae bacterium]
MKLLFICTHNRCRSILAEAVTNHFGQSVLVAKSAGSQPVGEVHPLSLKFLSEANISTTGLTSQSWDDHESWQPDVVITVCDSAAGEPCPLWFGDSLKVHWGLVDPSRMEGSEAEIAKAFQQTIELLKARIEQLLILEVANSDKKNWPSIFQQVGEH